MFIFKLVIHALAIIGLILLFCSQMDWLTDKDKVEFIKEMKQGRKVDPESKGAKKFLNDHFYTLNMTSEEKAIEIDAIIYVGPFMKTGERKDALSGLIKVRNIHGEVTPSLLSISEAERWAKTTPFWDWLALGLVAISIFVAIGMTILERIKEV